MYDSQFEQVDPDQLRENGRSATGKLTHAMLNMVGISVGVAFFSLALPQPDYSWADGLMAAVFGAIVMARFAKREELPVIPGVLSGMISGGGIYVAIMALILEMQVISRLLLLLFAVIGALPGLALFYILVWLYYSIFDHPNHPKPPGIDHQ